MLDFNSRGQTALHVNAAIDVALSDRAVRVLRACDAGELLPRIATSADFHVCRFCPWAKRCWSLPA